jgi:hypothetical protein
VFCLEVNEYRLAQVLECKADVGDFWSLAYPFNLSALLLLSLVLLFYISIHRLMLAHIVSLHHIAASYRCIYIYAGFGLKLSSVDFKLDTSGQIQRSRIMILQHEGITVQSHI